jgi:hypothetical protein
MKIAFCLSGGPRFKHRGLFQLIDAIKGFDQADLFIRTWKTDLYGNTPEEFENYLRKNGLPDNCIVRVNQVLDDIPEHQPEHIPLNLCGWAPNFLTMWWGMVKVNELRKQYQAETGVKYDAVFRMRTDMIPEGTFDLRDYVDQLPTTIINSQNFAENFLFGGEEIYDRFIEYWNHLYVLSERWEFIHPEESLEKYFNEVGIPFQLLPIIVMPERDHDEYDIRQKYHLTFDRPV